MDQQRLLSMDQQPPVLDQHPPQGAGSSADHLPFPHSAPARKNSFSGLGLDDLGGAAALTPPPAPPYPAPPPPPTPGAGLFADEERESGSGEPPRHGLEEANLLFDIAAPQRAGRLTFDDE
jgi:hypothetical protein